MTRRRGAWRWRVGVAGVLAGAWLVLACGSDSSSNQPLPPGWGPGQSPAPAAATPAAPATPPPARPTGGRGVTAGMSNSGIDPVKDAVLAEVRKRAFRNDDFVEGEENRDPFHSYLSEFSGGTTVTTQYEIKVPKYSLDELKLVAIIGPPSAHYRKSPGAAPAKGGPVSGWSAMFIDPTGKGISIVRGDHMSKVDAKVTRISADRLTVELKEDLGAGKTRMIERVLELHANEPTNEVP